MSKGWYSPLMFPFSHPGNFLVDIALLSNSVTWCHYHCISWICFSPSLPAPFCPGLVRDLRGEQASFHIAWLLPPLGFWHQITFTSSEAVHQRVTSLLLLFFGKYLSEQIDVLILLEHIFPNTCRRKNSMALPPAPLTFIRG